MGQLTTRQLTGAHERQSAFAKTSGLKTGTLLQDRYQIMGRLGIGGFSSVYKARDMRFPTVTKLFAVKEMFIATEDPYLREQTIKSFEREASMLAMLNHPAIPDISDYFTDGNSSYLVIELIDGQDLEDWLDQTDELLDEQRGLEWALQVCEALAYLHNQKPQPIVFRDIKPSNIMLDENKRIRLIDFGIAKLFEGEQERGTMIGTEGYTPPEQYRGEATPAVDVYGLGATLHHLLTRQDPRHETPFTFSERPITEANPQISKTFEAVIMRCLAYDPKDRYPDAMALREALLMLSEVNIDDSDAEQLSIALGIKTAVPRIKVGISQVQPLWKFKCEDEIRSKAAIDKGIVLTSSYDNNVYAVSAEKGEFLWKYPTNKSIGTSPCIHEDRVYITSTDKNIYALQLRNGREIWRFSAEGAIYSSPVLRFDHLFFGSDDGYFYALNAGSGRRAWQAMAYSPVRSSPYISQSQQLLYFGTEDGQIYSLELASGKLKWQANAERAVTSSPTVAEGVLFTGSMDATVYALDAATGWPIWRFRTQRPVISSPVVHNKTVYVGSADGNLYAIDVDSGRKVWSYKTNGQISSSPVIWQNAVYFGSTDGNVYGLNLNRGELIWRFEANSIITASPTIADGRMYIGTLDHQLYALPL